MNQNEADDRQRQAAEAILSNPREPDDIARAHLVLGALDEHRHDWEGAIAHYRAVLAQVPQDSDTRYFGNNNLGFSLIQLGRLDEAEPYCVTATEVKPRRHNAYKNLGLVFIGQGRWLDGALSRLEASRRAPDDPRAWQHLEQLLRAKPSLLDQSLELRTGISLVEKALAGGEGARVH
jgi:tetratricopeptide (TPR) repeat protein